jgi:hypothetical protein
LGRAVAVVKREPFGPDKHSFSVVIPGLDQAIHPPAAGEFGNGNGMDPTVKPWHDGSS